MIDKIKSYQLSPQLKAELNFASKRNKHSFDFNLKGTGSVLKKLPWKYIGTTAVVFALIISGYLGIKKEYDHLAQKSHQADVARQQEYQNHLQTIKDEVAKAGTSAYSFVELSQGYIKSGDAERAEAAAILATEKDPNWRDGFINLGQIYMSVNKFDQAKVTLDEALKRDPVYGQTHYLLSHVYQELRDNSASQAEFAKAKTFGFSSEIGG